MSFIESKKKGVCKERLWHAKLANYFDTKWQDMIQDHIRIIEHLYNFSSRVNDYFALLSSADV